MPRASLSGFSNGASGERAVYFPEDSETVLEDMEQQAGLEAARAAEEDIAEDEEVESSAGTSSSTSGSSPGKSGTSTMTDPQSPAPETDSPSSRDPQPSQEYSTAPSTGGSGQGTTSGQQNQQDSSAASAQRGQATRAQVTRKGVR